MKTTKTVVIFGVFDGLHEGHRAFIKEAKTYGDVLLAIVARDSAVEKIKGKTPRHTEEERLAQIQQVEEIDRACFGDSAQGEYHVLKLINPDIICFGYDQQGLFENVKENIKTGMLPSITLIIAKPFKPDEFHSSILY